MKYNINGWVDDPDGVSAVESEVGVFGSAASFLTGTGKDKIVCLYDDWTKLQMEYLYLNQGSIGSCVAEATAGGVDQLKVSEIAGGQREEFIGGTVAEAIYYGARVVVGGSRIRGDGALVANAIKYIYDRGTLARKKYSFADLSSYSVQRCRDWGNNKGIPKDLEVESKKYVIGNYARVRSWEEARDSIANKCPVVFGSSYGFSSETDDEGFCRQNTTWQHAMLLFAIDDHSKRKGGAICNCFCEDTEILTENGWKLFKNLKEGESVATMNLESNTLEFHIPTEYHEYKYNGVMHHHTGRHIDSLVTPNHNMVSWKKGKKEKGVREFDLIESDNLRKSNYFIRHVDDFKGNEVEKIEICGYEVKMDDWLQFLGFYLSEGWSTIRVRERSRKRNNGIITVEKDGYCGISQNDGGVLELMEDIVSRLPFKFSKKKLYKNDNHYQLVCYDSNFAEYLTKFGRSSEKHIPNYVFNLSQNQQRLLFKNLMLGDGIKSNFGAYYTTSKRLRDDFQRLCINLGYTSDYYKVRDEGTTRGGVIANHDCYRITVAHKKGGPSRSPMIGTPDEVQYSGMVYCVTVKNHTVITRRNGKMLITGQSWGRNWLKIRKRKLNQPDGSFWADAEVIDKIMKNGDAWSICDFKGYKAKIDTSIVW